MKTKLRKHPFPNTKAELDFYWAVLVKARAGFVSEISGQEGELHAHHLRGKSSYSLRYSLLNGISVTAGEHKFGFHHAERQASYEEQVKDLRGSEIFSSLALLKNCDSQTTNEIREYLLKGLREYKSEIKRYFHNKNYKNTQVIKRWKYLLEAL